MINDQNNKIPPTTTVSQLTEKTLNEADGDWIPIKIDNSDNIFYHVDLQEHWPRGYKDSTGRWAGLVKPNNKQHADDLYNLSFHDKSKKWYLHTFKFIDHIIYCKDAVYFQSKVKNGIEGQIKINNIAIEKIEVLKMEELK